MQLCETAFFPARYDEFTRNTAQNDDHFQMNCAKFFSFSLIFVFWSEPRLAKLQFYFHFFLSAMFLWESQNVRKVKREILVLRSCLKVVVNERGV